MGEPQEMERFWRMLESHIESDAKNFGEIRDSVNKIAVGRSSDSAKLNILMGMVGALSTAGIVWAVTQFMHLATTVK